MASAEKPTRTALKRSFGWPEAPSQPASMPACATAPQTRAIVKPEGHADGSVGPRTRRDAANTPSTKTTSDTADRTASEPAELPTASPSKTMLPLIIAVNTLPSPRKLIASTAPDPNVRQISRTSRSSSADSRDRNAGRIRGAYVHGTRRSPSQTPNDPTPQLARDGVAP